MIGKGTNRKSMNYVENVAAFLEFCLNNGAGENLFNYCDQPAYDMNTLVFDVYKSLGKTKKHIFHWPYWLGYFGGLCFDLLAKITHRKFPINSIRFKKFCQNTYFTSSSVPETGFIAPVSLEKKLIRKLLTKNTKLHTKKIAKLLDTERICHII